MKPPIFTNLSELGHTDAEVMYIYDTEVGVFRAASSADFAANHKIGYQTFARGFEMGITGGISYGTVFIPEVNNTLFAVSHISFSISPSVSGEMSIHAHEQEWQNSFWDNNILLAQHFSLVPNESKQISMNYSIPWTTKNVSVNGDHGLSFRTSTEPESGIICNIIGVVHGYYIPVET